MNSKKIFSLILAMMMLLTLIPTGAFAEDFELFEEEFGQEEYWEDEQLFEEESYYEEPVYEDFYIGEEPAYEEVLVDEFVPEEEEAIIEETAPAEPVDSADEFKEDQIVTLGDSETFDASTLVVTAPADVTVEPDGTATFHVEVSGGVAPYTYKWSVLVVGKTAFQATKLGGYDTDTLSFTAPASYNGRKFRCRVTDANGETVTSEEALLTVQEGAAQLEVTAPADVTVAPSKTATFHVEVSGGTAPYTYKWEVLKVGGTAYQATKLGGYDTDTLSFKASTTYTGRKFHCIVTDANGATVTSEEALLTVQEGAAQLEVTAPADVTVAPSKTATFHVEVSGGTAPYTYKWEVLKVGGTAYQATKLGGYDTDTLSFKASTTYTGRKFHCIVTDANGATVTSEEALLTVEEPSKDFEYGDFIFTKLSETDKTLTLKKYTGNSSTVIVPELIEDYTTVEIGEGAFEDNITLQSVDLPDTITVIRARAFKGCTSLAEMK